jgi:uncharacterized phage protein (TIGR01671 family)
MREINFRCWDITNKTMHAVGLLLIGHGATGYSYPALGEDANVGTEDTNRVVMQFTGLKDKNGKEIYEGDIVNIPNAGNYQVKWMSLGWSLHLVDDVEVIGNIYENPELLK